MKLGRLGGLLLSGLRWLLQWLGGSSVKVVVWFNWGGGHSVVRWRGLKFLSQFGGQVFVVEFWGHKGCRAEWWVGLGRWLSRELAGEVLGRFWELWWSFGQGGGSGGADGCWGGFWVELLGELGVFWVLWMLEFSLGFCSNSPLISPRSSTPLSTGFGVWVLGLLVEGVGNSSSCGALDRFWVYCTVVLVAGCI